MKVHVYVLAALAFGVAENVAYFAVRRWRRDGFL